jgi:4-amino-4-deoxychorismate lyase
LKLVEADVVYDYKYVYRTALDALFEKRGRCDDVLVVKNGFITDTTIANIAFGDSNGVWYTPATCLLRGTMRKYLLDSGRIFEASIRPGDLSEFRSFKVINALRDWSVPESEVSNIE